MVKIVYLGIFGGLGCVARYMISGWVYNLAGRSLPYGTLAVNVIGSLLLGVIMEGSLRSTLLSPDLRIGLTVGFMGGFTTFSTFSYETVRLLEGEPGCCRSQYSSERDSLYRRRCGRYLFGSPDMKARSSG